MQNEHPENQPHGKFSIADVVMLSVIVTAVVLVFGLVVVIPVVLPGSTAFATSSDIVAVMSPAFATVGTIAAGIFGFSLGSRPAGEAQNTANRATQQAADARREAERTQELTRPLVQTVNRIVRQAQGGGPAGGVGNVYGISLDDLRTMLSASNAIAPMIREPVEPEGPEGDG